MAETVRSDEPGPTAKESKLCSVCGRKIEGQFVRALNGHYHLECFRCQDCNQVVAEKFFPLEGPSGPQIFCEKDYFRRLDLLCAKCGGALRGPHINALNKKYHLEHFTCSVCPTVFRQHDSYYERDGEVYCQYHYSVRYAAKCGGCQTAVLKNFVEMNKENTVEQWHPECYMIYKLWNVKVASSKHGPLVPATSQPSASTEEEVRKQQVTVEKVGRILHVLSAFEESSAECISDMLIHFSNQHYEDGVLQAGKFICHIEALFTGIDEIEAQLGKHGDRTGLQHTKEPKQLAKKIVTFFSLLSLARESTQRQEATKELISLVTSLARALKILIRAALNGALKLERSYGSDTAVDDFLDKLMSLGEVRDANDERRLRASYSPQVKTDLCPVCRKSVEEECVKFGNLRWHSACFKCSTCGKELRSTYKDAMYDETSSRIYCGEHATSASKIGFEKVTQLEQYTFLLRCALKRLCILLNVRIDSHVAGEPEVISEKIKRSNEILLPAGEDADALARKVSRSKGAVPGADMEQMQVPSLSNAAHHDTMVSYPDDFRSSLKKEVEVEGVMPPRPATQTPLSQHSPSPTPQPLPPQQQQQPLQPTAQLQPLQPQPQLLQQQALQTVPQQINTSLGPRPDNGANGVKSPFSPPHGLQKALSSGEQGYPLGIGLPGSGPNAAANAVLAAGLGPSPIPEGFGSISAAVKAGRPVYLSELGPLEHLAVRQLAALKMHPLMEKFYTWDELMEFADMRKPSMWSKMVEAMKPVGKKNQKVKVEGTFGVPLEILVERYGIETEMGPGPTSTRIPLIMDACVRTLRNMDLRVEGIFRKNGNIKRLKTVTEALDRDPLSIDLSEDGPIQVAALMKKFLRDMPEPLLTFKLHKLFIAAQKLPDEKSRREALHYVCCLLPKPNLDLLEVLLWFLREVAQYSSTVGDEASGNRMDIDNLATVITPNILYSKSKNPADDESFLAIQALRMLLRYQNEMWLVPENVVEALREDRTAFELANADPNAKEKDLKKIDDVLVKMKKSCDKFNLLFVGPPTKKQIDALASHGDLTFAASESSIYVYKRAKEIKVLRIDDGDDEGSYTVSHLMIMGDLILALCSDNVLRMWNFRTFEYYNEISFGSTFRATTMIHPSTYLNKVLIASQEGRMQIWNIHTMRLIYDFPKSFGSPITILAQSPVVDVIAVGMLDGRIILHNIKFDQEVISVKQEDKVTGISFRTDEQPLMASANMHGDVALWDLDERRLFNVMRGAHDGAVVSTFFLNGQPLLITVGGDNSVKCWIFDTLDGTPRLLKSRSGHHGPPSMIRFYDEEGRFLLSSGRDRSLKLFSLFRDAQNTEFSQGSIEKKSKKLGMKIDELKLSQILHFASSPAKEKQWSNIVTCHANDASARTWDFRNKAIGKHVLTASDNATVKAVTISPCGNFAYIGSSKGKIDMFNMQSGLHRKTFHSEQGHFKSIVGLAVDSVNRVLISGSLDQALIFWDVRSGKAISSMKFSTPISAITLHKDSGLVAVTCDDLCVRIVDIDTRKVVREFWGHRNRIMDCAFSPDGRWLVSTSLDGTIRTWDLPTGHLVDCFRTASIATSVAFSPTGDFLASVHVDELGIFLWSNRAQFKNVALKNIQDDDAIFVSLPSPTGATEDAETKGDSASRVPDEDNMDESADLSVPDDSLIALSDVPATRWQTLLNIEAIKKRNKPKEPPKAPVKAPFFLSAAGPSQSVPDKEHSSSDAENAPKSRIFNSTSSSMIFSDFVERLRAGHEDNDFTEFWKYVRTLSPSALDFEIRSMDVETGDISDVSFFIEALKFQLRTKKDFELVEAYLAVLLKVHGQAIVNSENHGGLVDSLAELKSLHEDTWRSLDEKFQYGLCMVKFVRT